MERKLGRWPVIIGTILAAGAAYILRLRQLEQMYDAEGLVIRGMGKGPLTWLCAAAVLAAAICARLLLPRKEYDALSSSASGVLLCGLAGAAGMALGSVALALDLERSYDILLAAGGVVTAICWAAAALDRARGRRIPAALLMLPTLFFAVELVLEFRNWSKDPAILDYCFDLLALICVMCASFELGGFCFDKGRRRSAVFFCCCAAVFGAAAVAGSRLRELCMTGGAVLWLMSSLWPLLGAQAGARPGKKGRGDREAM